MAACLSGERLRNEPERERTGEPCSERLPLLLQLLDLLRHPLNQLLELLELRRHPLQQQLRMLELLLLELLHLLELLRNDSGSSWRACCNGNDAAVPIPEAPMP